MKAWIQGWLERRSLRRSAEKLLRTAIVDPKIHARSSIRPRHLGRYVILDIVEDEQGGVDEVHFGIMRHPKPYAFSPHQHHEVVELCIYFVATHEIRVQKGINQTRRKGLDAG